MTPDRLPGIDYILYTDDLVPSLIELADLYRDLGDDTAAAAAYCRLAAAVPDAEIIRARLDVTTEATNWSDAIFFRYE